jgi:hypothetical protein
VRFNLHQVRFQYVSASCVEVVALIKRVCFYVSSPEGVMNKNSGAVMCVPILLVNWQTISFVGNIT